MELYTLRNTDTPGTFSITKFDKNLEVESNYLVTYDSCTCPRSFHRNCRHRAMLYIFKQHKHIGDGWFLDYPTRQWLKPSENQDYHEPDQDLDVEALVDALETVGLKAVVIDETPEQEKQTEAKVLPPSVAPAPAAVPVSGAQTRKPKLGLRPL